MKKVSSLLCVFSLLFVGVCQAKMRTGHKQYGHWKLEKYFDCVQELDVNNRLKKTIKVKKVISYGSIAHCFGLSVVELNELNGLRLSKNTLIAVGSELNVLNTWYRWYKW